MKILHVITGLLRGGAEQTLVRLIESSSDGSVHHHVLVLGQTDQHLLGRLQRVDCGITVLRGRSRLQGVLLLARVWREARALRPDAVQGWMYDGNIAAWVASLAAGARLFFNIRHSVHALAHERLSTRLAIRLNAVLARSAKAAVFNSKVALQQHVALGFPAKNAVAIPNGFDLAEFSPGPQRDAKAGEEGAFVFGCVARLHPMKSHDILIKAFVQAFAGQDRVKLVCVGQGDPAQTAYLRALVEALGIGRQVSFLGLRDDVAQLIRQFDALVCASSWGEAFSNVIGEAMASGVPCIATDVGDSRFLVGDSGWIVAPGSVDELAAAMSALTHLPEQERRAMGARARRRVQENWSQAATSARYHRLYSDRADASEA